MTGGFTFERKINFGHIISLVAMALLAIGAFYGNKLSIDQNANDIRRVDMKVETSNKEMAGSNLSYLDKFNSIDARFTKIDDKTIENAREISSARERMARIEVMLQSNSKQLDKIASLLEEMNKESRKGGTPYHP